MVRLEWTKRLEVPMRLSIAKDEVEPWEPQEPDEFGNAFVGRVVTWEEARAVHAPGPIGRIAPPQIPMPRESVANLTENDVVYIPLFTGYDPTKATGVDDRLPDDIYRENFASMEELAKRGAWIMLGNAGPETAFGEYPGKLVMAPKAQWGKLRDEIAADWEKRKNDAGVQPTPIEGLDGLTDEEVDCNTKYWRYGPAILDEQVRFLLDCHQIVADVGGRFAFSPNAMELALDLYFQQGRLRRQLLRINALLVQFLGFVEWQRTDRPCVWESPFGGIFNPMLSGYLRGLDAITGMEFKAGLEAGNDLKAKEHGYSGGLIGWV